MKINEIAWVVDSTTYVTEEMRNKADIFVVPMNIMIDGKEYKDGVDITYDELCQRVTEGKEEIKTSQPSVGEVLQVFEEIENKYKEIVCFTLSSKLSGTYSTFCQAKDMVSCPVHVIDTTLISYMSSDLVDTAIEEIKSHGDIERMLRAVEEKKEKYEVYIMIGSLQRLHKSGRMTGVQYMLGSMLSIRPVLTIEEGLLVLKDKVRSEKKVLSYMLEKFGQEKNNSHTKMMILHVNCEDKAKEWEQIIKEKFPQVSTIVAPLASSIAVHGGEGTLALCWI